MSGLFGKSREGYYSVSREKRNRLRLNERMIVDKVRELRSEAPGIGAYKMFLILKSIFPDAIPGRDKFYEIIHKNNLMLKPERRRHTTNSNHNYRKYKNLIKGFVPIAPNTLWVSDITYIETETGIVYLHIVTDAWTHEIIGWYISETLHAEHTIRALKAAIYYVGTSDLKGLIHHSDRGSQYCCNAYIDLLHSIGASISMTEDYKPTDNAVAERVNGIIKQEWLYRMKRPKNIQEARKIIGDIVNFYNTKRPHMSNNMMTPVQKKASYMPIA
ncbi:MAG: IS3 family transposase [Roseburia sp.]